MKITHLLPRDIRFPTSREKDGSDALNLGDYSAVYVMLETDAGLAGYGLTFTNGHGTEIGVAARWQSSPRKSARGVGTGRGNQRAGAASERGSSGVGRMTDAISSTLPTPSIMQ